MEQRQGKRYSKEFRQQAVERMNTCGNIIGLARELSVARRVSKTGGIGLTKRIRRLAELAKWN